jgi:hypothetical protein
MDPYLEGHLWPDVHSALAGEVRRRLVPILRPRYVARLEVTVVEDQSPEAEIGIMYPDVEVFDSRLHPAAVGASAPQNLSMSGSALAAPLTIPRLSPVELRLTSVEIRDAAGNALVTTIEILSPVNKREPGISRQRKKRERLLEAGVHLLEVDLLRRGTRILAGHPRLPPCSYLVTLTRSRAPGIGVWALGLRSPLPEIPVPLREPDPDVSLRLGDCLRAVYDEAAYDLSIDYRKLPPPPPLEAEDEAWMAELMSHRSQGSQSGGG